MLKEKISKIMGALVSLYSMIVMLYALMCVIVMDVIWPFAVAAVLVCPFWFWIVDKKWLHDKAYIRWFVRIGVLALGCLIFSLGRQYCPYYRYMDMMAKENVRVYFEDHKEELTQSGDKDVTYVKVADIKHEDGEPLHEGDGIEYYVVTAHVEYTVNATKATEISKEVKLLFDRYSGQFFENMDKMQQYWVAKNSNGAVTGSAVSESAVEATEDEKELCRRYTYCSEKCRYEANGKEGTDEGLISLARGGQKTEYTYEELGIPADGDKFLMFVNATELFVSVEKKDVTELWVVPIKQENGAEVLEKKATKVLSDEFGMDLMYANDDVIGYFDSSRYYREYDRKNQKRIKVTNDKDQLLTYSGNPEKDDEYMGTVVSGNVIVLALRDENGNEVKKYMHRFLSEEKMK
ncbi:MAG: hypothetical protein J5972_04395 [Eubacterium sp.]|nr:hypothetical protein [Eubacterium sp.]